MNVGLIGSALAMIGLMLSGIKTANTPPTQIFAKLHLPDSPDAHRRALAVLTFMRH